MKVFLFQSLACLLTLVASGQDQQSAIVVNVRDLGAVGDGQTDDTKAIQAAIDKVAKTGGKVLLPPSKQPYLIRNALTIRASQTELYGPGATIKMADHAIDGKVIDCLEIVGTEQAIVENVTIRGLTIDANYWQQKDSYNPRGIDSDWATKVLIDKVTIKQPFVGLTFGLGVTHSEARDCVITQWHNDAYDASGDGRSGICHHIRFVRCRAVNSPNQADGGLAGSRDDAWELEDGCFDVELIDCVVENAGGTGFGVRNHGWPHAVATRRISFTRCRTKNVRSGWVVRGTDHQVTVSGVKLIKCQTDAVGSTFTQGVGGIEITDSSFTGLLLLGMRGTQAAELEIADRPARDVIISNTSIGRFKANLKPGNNGKMDYQPTAQLINVKAESAQVFGSLKSLKTKGCQFKTPLKHGGQP